MPDERSNCKNPTNGDKGFLRCAWSELQGYKDQNPLGVCILVGWIVLVGILRCWGIAEDADIGYLLGGAFVVAAAFLRAKSMEQSVKVQSHGQVHERFSRAVDLLSDDSGGIVKFFAGMYALNHIAREWKNEYRRPVFEIFCGYLRTKDLKENRITEKGQAILGLLFDTNSIYQGLSADLKGANLGYAILNGSQMSGADLTDARMINAKLREADLHRSNFSKIEGGSIVDFTNANLRDGKFCHAELVGVDFIGAKLHKADFNDACLETVDFTDAEGIMPEMFFRVRKWKGVTGVSQSFENAVKKNNSRAFEDDFESK